MSSEIPKTDATNNNQSPTIQPSDKPNWGKRALVIGAIVMAVLAGGVATVGVLGFMGLATITLPMIGMIKGGVALWMVVGGGGTLVAGGVIALVAACVRAVKRCSESHAPQVMPPGSAIGATHALKRDGKPLTLDRAFYIEPKDNIWCSCAIDKTGNGYSANISEAIPDKSDEIKTMLIDCPTTDTSEVDAYMKDVLSKLKKDSYITGNVMSLTVVVKLDDGKYRLYQFQHGDTVTVVYRKSNSTYEILQYNVEGNEPTLSMHDIEKEDKIFNMTDGFTEFLEFDEIVNVLVSCRGQTIQQIHDALQRKIYEISGEMIFGTLSKAGICSYSKQALQNMMINQNTSMQKKVSEALENKLVENKNNPDISRIQAEMYPKNREVCQAISSTRKALYLHPMQKDGGYAGSANIDDTGLAGFTVGKSMSL